MTTSAEDFAATIAEIIRTLSAGVTFGEGDPVAKGGTWGRESLESGYRWLLAVEPARGTGGSLCPVCGGIGGTYSESAAGAVRWVRCEQCTPGMVGDPTGDATMRARLVRTQADRAYKHLQRALAEVRGAVDAVQSGYGVHDGKVRSELPHERAMPRTATRDEVKAARAAKARRVARGEGWGES